MYVLLVRVSLLALRAHLTIVKTAVAAAAGGVHSTTIHCCFAVVVALLILLIEVNDRLFSPWSALGILDSTDFCFAETENVERKIAH